MPILCSSYFKENYNNDMIDNIVTQGTNMDLSRQHESFEREISGENFKLDILASVCSLGVSQDPVYNSTRDIKHSLKGYYNPKDSSFPRSTESVNASRHGFSKHKSQDHLSKRQAEENACDRVFSNSDMNSIRQHHVHALDENSGSHHFPEKNMLAEIDAMSVNFFQHDSSSAIANRRKTRDIESYEIVVGERKEAITSYQHSTENSFFDQNCATVGTCHSQNFSSRDEALVQWNPRKREHLAIETRAAVLGERDENSGYLDASGNFLPSSTLKRSSVHLPPSDSIRSKESVPTILTHASTKPVLSLQQGKQQKRTRSDHKTRWDLMFEELYKFKSLHGHCQVPCVYTPYPALSQWVTTQRSMYRARNEGLYSTMTDERLKKLDGIGFVWAVQNPSLPWEVRYNQLKEYKEKHGTISISRQDQQQKKLAEWVSIYMFCQACIFRSQYHHFCLLIATHISAFLGNESKNTVSFI